MRKLHSLVLATIIFFNTLFSVAFASDYYEALENLGNYGNLEYIYDNMEVSYDYNGERVYLNKNHMTFKELEVMLRALSVEKLSFKDIKTHDPVETTDPLFPKKGYVEFLDENDGNWVIAFDENEVYARCIDPINKTFRHGFYKYDSLTPYSLFAFFNNIVKRGTGSTEEIPDNPSEEPTAKPDTPKEPEPEIHENQINVFNMSEIYSASFPLGNFSEGFAWGVCSYTRESETTPVTVAYMTFKGMEFLKLLTEAEIKNNTIEFDSERVAYFEKGKDGIEYDIDFGLTNDFKLKVNVDDNGQVCYAVMTYQNIMHTGSPVITEVIDMTKYEQNGHLPSIGKISFNKANNIQLDEENKDDEKNVADIEKLNWVYSIDDIIYEPEGEGVLKIDNSVMVSLTELCQILGYNATENNNQVIITEKSDCKNSKGAVKSVKFKIGDSYFTVTEKSGKTETIEEPDSSVLSTKYNNEIYVSAYHFANILDLKLKNDSFENEKIILFTRNYLSSEDTNIVSFDELTKLTDKNITEVTIRKHADEIKISSPHIISTLIDNIKNLELFEHNDSGAGGWLYWIIFNTDSGEKIEYTASTGAKVNGKQYRASDDSKVREALGYYFDMFKSLNCSEWATDVVAEAIEYGIINIDNSWNFPSSICREDFCNIAVKMIESCMVDLPSDNQYNNLAIADTQNENVKKLCRAGIILGKGQNENGIIFAPDDLITREEAATILYRIARLLKIEFPDAKSPEYTDQNDISDWAKESTQKMYEIGVMNGISETEFSPKGIYTVEQSVATMVRLFKIMKG